ncbi:MAG: coproporphyrinogen III oxidase [Alphaproteobacteria bacterium]|nr:coproporphyrinogen III oxidase [Alphaproteobacteria bacterium]
MTGGAAPLALYVHWPWCRSKCPYCDFNSRALDPATFEQGGYRGAVLAELAHYAAGTPGREVTSIFFGGGTPSLMAPDTVAAVIDAAAKHWGLADDCEITLEANPTSIEASKFRAMRDAGINRTSVGVQALNDRDLLALGREHSVEEAVRALEIAGAMFERVSFDLIYARPGQGVGEWADELEQALDIAGGHLSLYQLSVEPGTDFFRARVPEAAEDLAAELYELTQEMTAEAGLPAYEISNHARPGEESRHNLVYWRGGDYVGVGPGAHGRVTDGTVTRATHQIADPARWLDAALRDGHATAKTVALSARERAEELVMTGLRVVDGLDAALFLALTGQSLDEVLNRAAREDLVAAGLLEADAQGVRATASGRLMLNRLVQKLLD